MTAALLGVFAALVAAGVGAPLPEDMTLLTAGYLVWRGHAPLWAMALVALCGLVAGDVLLFLAGRTLLRTRLGSRLIRRIGIVRMEAIAGWFARHGAKPVFVARFVPGTRAAVYFTAGAVGFPLRRFVPVDTVGACCSAALWIGIGTGFGDKIDRVREAIRSARHWVLLVVGVIVVALVVAHLVRRRILAA